MELVGLGVLGAEVACEERRDGGLARARDAHDDEVLGRALIRAVGLVGGADVRVHVSTSVSGGASGRVGAVPTAPRAATVVVVAGLHCGLLVAPLASD